MGRYGGSGDSKMTGYILSVVLLVLGLSILREIYLARVASAEWETARATVTANEVRRMGRKSPNTYNTYIDYTYDAAGYAYQARGVEVERDSFYMTSWGAEKELNRDYPVGRAFEVYYNPANPAQSNLGEANAPSLLWAAFFMSLAAFILRTTRS